MNIDSAAIYFLIASAIALPVFGIAAVIRAVRRNQRNRLSQISSDDSSQP